MHWNTIFIIIVHQFYFKLGISLIEKNHLKKKKQKGNQGEKKSKGEEGFEEI